jgi:hypothetical protein
MPDHESGRGFGHEAAVGASQESHLSPEYHAMLDRVRCARAIR